jgi:desulfoferrodoxin-like iron-binding protein
LNVLSNNGPVKQREKHTIPTESNKIFECKICDAVVEIKEDSASTLECCGLPMATKE